jgi:hypothetical protein
MRIPYSQLNPSPEYINDGIFTTHSEYYFIVSPILNKVFGISTNTLKHYIKTKDPMTATFEKSIGALVPADALPGLLSFPIPITSLPNHEQNEMDKCQYSENLFLTIYPNAIYNKNQPIERYDYLLNNKKIEIKYDSKGGNPYFYIELYTIPKTKEEKERLFGKQ